MSLLELQMASSLHLNQTVCFFIQTLSTSSHFQDCLQNVASGAPNGQFSTFELKCVFYTNFIDERPFPGLSPKCRFRSSKWLVLYILHLSVNNGNLSLRSRDLVF